MYASEQKIKAITKDFYERLALFDADSFVHKISSISKHIDLTYQSLLKQYDSRIFFGDTVEQMKLSDYEYNSFHIMRIIAIVTEELQKNQGNLDSLQEIISATTNQSELPNWLKERVIRYVPLLLLKKYTQEFNKPEQSEHYVVFLRGDIKQMDKAELDKFRKKNSPDAFDIFIENTDYVSIYIQNREKLFRAGNYHPFNILSLFLQSLGKSLTYKEIYYLAIKPTERVRPRDHSKKVYDYVKNIKKKIRKCEEIDIDPDEWFKREHENGIIHISKSINSCLIATDQHLLI